MIQRLIEIGYALKPLKQDFRSFHVAGIFKKNRLISIGTNEKKSHPFALKNGYPWANNGIHAECLAIIRAKLEDFSNHTLIVIRIDNSGKINLSKPCHYCSNLISKMSFSKVLFSNATGRIERLF